MRVRSPGLLRAGACLAAVLLASAAGAQTVDTGNLYGTVTDAQGAPLGGVAVTLSGIGAPQLQTTDAQGQFRFLNLAPGAYRLEAVREGFASLVYESADVRVNRNTTVELKLPTPEEAKLVEVLTIVAESPLLDARKIHQGISVTSLELEKLPTARDPWAIAGQTPLVVMDRINVGGNESGQQAIFVGSGSRSDQNVFLLDGVNVTDPAALGGSATYFGFDQFDQMEFSTGGSDVAAMTPGVQLNLVTKRGTNEWRASGRYLLTDGDWQSDSGLDDADMPAEQRATEGLQRNEIVEVTDRGLEGGGPLVRDRLWIWGAYDETEIQLRALGGAPDDTLLENYAGKLNAQLGAHHSLVGSYNFGDKRKQGRDAGPTRPPETTFDQEGPTPVYKLEDSFIVGSKLILTGSWSRVDGGFSLTPQGGIDEEAFLDEDGVWRRTYYLYLDTERPTETAQLSGSLFFGTGDLSHDLRFGASYRSAENNSVLGFTGRGIVVQAGENLGIPGTTELAIAFRDKRVREQIETRSLWLQDTLGWERLTVNVGARYDLQEGENRPSSTAGVREPALPLISQDVSFGGNRPDFEWEDVLPRIGVTYGLGAERQTLLRGSYSRFADALGSAVIEHVNPASYSYSLYLFDDGNQNGVFEPASEPFTLLDTGGFDPTNPGLASTLDRIDPDFRAKTTDEILLGVEHAWQPEFVTGFTLTYRQVDHIARLIPFLRDTETGAIRLQSREDFVPFTTVSGTLPNGQPYSEAVWVLRTGLVNSGGSLLTTGGREQEYRGASLYFTKRLSHQWMLRGNAGWSDWTWQIDDDYFRFDDPTDQSPASPDLQDVSDDDDGVVAEQSGGSGNKGGVFIQSGWSFNLSGLYQVAPERPWGFNVAWSATGREGTPAPYFRAVARPRGGNVNVQVTDEVDSFRTDDVFSLDGRLEKEFELGPVVLTASLDGFNLLNSGAVLQRNLNLATRTNFVNEALSPRILRAGVRLSLR